MNENTGPANEIALGVISVAARAFAITAAIRVPRNEIGRRTGAGAAGAFVASAVDSTCRSVMQALIDAKDSNHPRTPAQATGLKRYHANRVCAWSTTPGSRSLITAKG